MKIVCIGDSITAGQYHDGPAWPALLTGYEVHAAGVSNDTTRLGLERFPRDVQEQNAQAVVIQFGHNDANRWETDRGLPRVSAGAFAENLAEMIRRCRVFGAEPLLCSLFPATKGERYTSDLMFYDSVIGTVALSMGVPVIPLWDTFANHPSLFLPDGLHLNGDGHRRYADRVQDALDRLYG